MIDYTRFKKVRVERDGKLLTATLNRPDRLNAVDVTVDGEIGLHEELEDLFALIARDSSVGAVLLTGAGRAFSAGGDVKQMQISTAGAGGAPAAALDEARRVMVNLLQIDQPIIAAVNGPAMGLGATLALACDVVIMSEEAYIADTHVSVGLVAGDGGAVLWPLLLPINRAKYYLMTGERIPGPEAERIGLVNKTVPADQLLP